MAYKVDNVKNYSDSRGWICGQFFPDGDVLQTGNLEVKYGEFKIGEKVSEHYHPIGDEVLIIISGKIKINLDGETHELVNGDFVFQQPGTKEEVLEVLEDTVYIAIRTPSVRDK